MDRSALLQPLGFRRNPILDCLGANMPRAPGWLDLSAGADIFSVYRGHVAALSSNAAWLSDRDTMLMLAAARLLTGAVDAAALIVSDLPEHAPTLRFGQRHCPLMPVRTLAAALPLPGHLGPPEGWLIGSAQQALLRQWLTDHSDALRWHEPDGIYTLS